MDALIKDTFQRDVLSSKVGVYKFFASLKDEKQEAVIDFCRWIISTYEYDDQTTIVKAAYHKLAHYRDVQSLEKLEELSEKWKNTYLEEYEYLLAMFNNARNGAVCNCNIYNNAQFNVPPYQDDLEIFGNDTRDHGEHMRTQIVYVRCAICKTEWEVEIDDTYHYPHSYWRKTS